MKRRSPIKQRTGIDRRRDEIAEISRMVLSDRCATHGDAEENFKELGAIWSIYLKNKLKPGASIDAVDVGWMHVAGKLARAVTSPRNPDHSRDAGGYSVCTAGIIRSESEKPTS